MLKITHEIIAAIIDHSKKELPHEACGYLAGTEELINKHYQLTNLDKSNEHFSMDPKEQFSTVRDVRSLGLKLRCVYHSHPETPARPSAEDIKLAFDPDISYIIVSLCDKEPVVKSFRIKDGEVTQEELEVIK